MTFLAARWLLILILFAVPVRAQDLEQLLDMLEGDFDNRAQYESQFPDGNPAANSSESQRSEASSSPSDGSAGKPLFSHLGLQRRRVEVPALGPYVVYAQINRRADSNDVYRQSLQLFTRDSQGNIRARNFGFRDRKKFADVLARPEQFPLLTEEDLVALLPEACDPHWQFEDGTWVSRIDRESCVITSRRDGKHRHIQATEFVTPDLIRNEESGYNESGELIFGLPPGTFYNYRRTRAANP